MSKMHQENFLQKFKRLNNKDLYQISKQLDDLSSSNLYFYKVFGIILIEEIDDVSEDFDSKLYYCNTDIDFDDEKNYFEIGTVRYDDPEFPTKAIISIDLVKINNWLTNLQILL